MRHTASTWCLLAAALAPAIASAQPLEAPVRYEHDHTSVEFHRSRRGAVLGLLPHNAIALFFGAPTRNRQNDVSYEYRQSSDLLYLTGSEEPGSVLLLAPEGVEVDGERAREILFVPPRDPSQEVWLGRRFGTEGAMRQLGVELAVEATRFDEIVAPLLVSADHQVFHLEVPEAVARDTPLAAQVQTFLAHVRPIDLPRGRDASLLAQAIAASSPELFGRLKEAGLRPAAFQDATHRAWAEAFASSVGYEEWAARRTELLRGRSEGTVLRIVLDELRTVKTDEEMRLLQRAIDITAEAQREVMTQVEPGWAEYEIEALVEYTFKRSGAEYPGFPSIVGSAENSVILHYETNRRTTEPGDVVVIDIGAEYHGYTADITRTIPVNGRYSPEQRAIYELVYAAQEAGIDAARAGNVLYAPHQAASRVLAEGLAELGLISGPEDQVGLRRFFMHGTSHYLGLDVHDVGSGGP
ncbi:MAG TPA: aminopeptidase P N-terminal domain-containing protein, partial [Longimicrobiales bacterium]|nr:aminopeptidase P N-terminal domain-containing protein [Longimicrobiales bacterium]